MYFQAKNTLKNNHYHNTKWAVNVGLSKWFNLKLKKH